MPDRWEEQFQELREFQAKHGHCSVPFGHPGGLDDWAAYQRSPQGKPQLTAHQVQQLDTLGFPWVGKTNFHKNRWQARFHELRKFKEKHGHCNVPHGHPGGLGRWASHQRKAGKEENRRCNPVRVKKLEELGYQWTMAEIQSDRWEARLRKLKEFQKEHGHCNVPDKYPGGLGGWVYEQRRAFKEGGRHDADQIKKLEELGFFRHVAKMPDRWEARLQELKEFKEEHGHCHVPVKHPGGLWRWVADQRYHRQIGGRGMTAGRVQKLEKLGFPWTAAEPVWQRGWEARLQELQEFQEEHGHCDVPSHYLPGRAGELGERTTYQQKGGEPMP